MKRVLKFGSRCPYKDLFIEERFLKNVVCFPASVNSSSSNQALFFKTISIVSLVLLPHDKQTSSRQPQCALVNVPSSKLLTNC